MPKSRKRKVEKVCKVAEKVQEIKHNTQLNVAFHFPSPIYLIERPDFLESVMEVSEESLKAHKPEGDMNEIYPVLMSGSYFADPRIAKFSEFIGATSWNILAEQGYAMQDRVVSFTEMWTQEHYKHSAMEQHAHGFGAQIVGFYFLEVPDESSRVVFHDPRVAKSMIDLPEADMGIASVASKMINFEPKPGLLIFSNAWLSHSFTRNASDKPIKFVHFNLTVQMAQQPVPVQGSKEVEVI